MKTILSCCAIVLICTTLTAQPDTLTIIHVNDTHSNLAPIGPRSDQLQGSTGGIARAATIIGLQQMTNPNPILLHAGDAFIGDLFYNAYMGVAEFQMMEAMGFDAMAVGNHEFDLTPEALFGALKAGKSPSGFPLLSANLVLNDPAVDSLSSYIRPFTVIQRGGIDIGLFGLTTPATNVISQPAPAIIDSNVVSAAAAMVDTLTALGCSVIICVSHMGVTLDALVASYVPGIDGIVGGHDHYTLTEPEFVQNGAGDSVWIVQAGSHYRYVGRLRLTVDGGAVRFLDYELIPVADPVPEEPTVKAMVDQLIADIETQFGQPFYTVQVGIVAEFLEEFDRSPLAYGNKDTRLGNLVTDAFRSAVSADIAIEANGSIAQPLYAGPIVAADVFRAVGYGFNLDNYLGYRMASFDIAGASLMAGLEYGLSTLTVNDDFLIQVSGMSYTYDPQRPEFSRLLEVSVGGQPIDPGASYSVVSNEFVPSFLGFLGLPFDNLHIFSDTTEFQVLLGYIAAVDTVRSAVEGRVRAERATEVPVSASAIPSAHVLEQNYPNPFNPSTSIRFSLPEEAFVELIVIDLLGRTIETLVSERRSSGTHAVVWHANVPTGVYFYRLAVTGSTGQRSFSKTRRMVLVR